MSEGIQQASRSVSEILQDLRSMSSEGYSSRNLFKSYEYGGPSDYYTSGYYTNTTAPSVKNDQLFEVPSSRVAEAVLSSNAPIDIKETESVNVLGESGILVNKEDILNWRGTIPLSDYPINEDPSPEILRKKPEQTLVYLQEVAVRYLRPPTPPPPGDIIIKEEASTVPPPAPPLIVRQQPPRPETPVPMIIREQPPKPPHVIGQKIVTISGKKIPPPPRKVIIERLPPIPSKPQSVVIERWLPYKERKRRVIYQKPALPDIIQKPKNIIIQWETPNVEIKKEFKELGVVRANPVEYVQKYGASLKLPFELPEFVKDIRPPAGVVLASEWQPSLYDLEGDIQALSLIDLEKEGLGEYKHLARQFETIGLKSGYEYSYPSGLGYSASTPSVYKTSSTGVGLTQSTSSTIGGLNTNGQLREIFSMLDVNSDGFITIDEARKGLLRVNEKLGRKYGEQDARLFIQNLDKNGDGRINFQEFKQAIFNNL